MTQFLVHASTIICLAVCVGFATSQKMSANVFFTQHVKHKYEKFDRSVLKHIFTTINQSRKRSCGQSLPRLDYKNYEIREFSKHNEETFLTLQHKITKRLFFLQGIIITDKADFDKPKVDAKTSFKIHFDSTSTRTSICDVESSATLLDNGEHLLDIHTSKLARESLSFLESEIFKMRNEASCGHGLNSLNITVLHASTRITTGFRVKMLIRVRDVPKLAVKKNGFMVLLDPRISRDSISEEDADYILHDDPTPLPPPRDAEKGRESYAWKKLSEEERRKREETDRVKQNQNDSKNKDNNNTTPRPISTTTPRPISTTTPRPIIISDSKAVGREHGHTLTPIGRHRDADEEEDLTDDGEIEETEDDYESIDDDSDSDGNDTDGDETTSSSKSASNIMKDASTHPGKEVWQKDFSHDKKVQKHSQLMAAEHFGAFHIVTVSWEYPLIQTFDEAFQSISESTAADTDFLVPTLEFPDGVDACNLHNETSFNTGDGGMMFYTNNATMNDVDQSVPEPKIPIEFFQGIITESIPLDGKDIVNTSKTMEEECPYTCPEGWTRHAFELSESLVSKNLTNQCISDCGCSLSLSNYKSYSSKQKLWSAVCTKCCRWMGEEMGGCNIHEPVKDCSKKIHRSYSLIDQYPDCFPPTVVESQLGCAASYAFATIGSFADRQCIKEKTSLLDKYSRRHHLSTQAFLSCNNEYLKSTSLIPHPDNAEHESNEEFNCNSGGIFLAPAIFLFAGNDENI